MSSTIATKLNSIHERIANAAQQAGRDPASVTLVVVTKTHPPALVAAAVAAGARDLGENRVQEALNKINALAELTPAPRWHLIGHLQRNKARLAATHFGLVHSVDSLRLAEALARHVPSGQRLPILLQFNVSGEASKEGFTLAGGASNRPALEALLPELERIVALPSLAVHGLMTIAPLADDPEAARPHFRTLRELRDELARCFPQATWRELSMGMSDDFTVAISEGATIVRLGRAILGGRQ
ncbi:YggS family pyridoxal phosphate-dependent enzyme [Candidatus Viridilinea mediisalina]|uniref:Pyridoxal phosphate homeostasis protein n=1 Tax=Candidatus Viridilinea mediisalina TaxID=2024553 RepID=A0A2A6RHH2_9CHLR|nr:YggS family pyridoxal phosphate-dependent enzyme [Candidatus Viridilinea mediisalina]PDW02346.1 YggS family pyridoxal phosphate-dependent enzyme [Candidatus Viridilinea mediisalina]